MQLILSRAESELSKARQKQRDTARIKNNEKRRNAFVEASVDVFLKRDVVNRVIEQMNDDTLGL